MTAPATPDECAADLQHRSGHDFLSHRRWRALSVPPGETEAGIEIPRALVERVMAAYGRSVHQPDREQDAESFWTTIFNKRHLELHTALLRHDVEYVKQQWEHPADNFCFHGFDEMQVEHTRLRRGSQIGKEIAAQRVYDNLSQLAVAMGVLRIENPEGPPQETSAVENMLGLIDGVMGYSVEFPNPYPSEFGLQTSRGVASYRALQALFQAYQTKLLVGERRAARVAEIGAGLGRAAYYSVRAGISDYTIVDLPFTGVSQSFFLATVLGDEAIKLEGESNAAPVKIVTPKTFMADSSRYDLIVNFDSLTEVGEETQRAYMEKIRTCTDVFLSVNHEYNKRTIRSFLQEYFGNCHISRDPYWMRRGYVQEIVTMASLRSS